MALGFDNANTVIVYLVVAVLVVFCVCRGQIMRIVRGSRGYDEYEYDGDQSTKIRHEGGI